MTVAEAIREVLAAHYAVEPVWQIFLVGDSLASGVSSGSNDGLSAAGKSWCIFDSDLPSSFTSEWTSKATARIGDWSMITAFVDEFYDLTGIRTFVTPLSKAGSALTYAAKPTYNWDFRGIPSQATGNLMFLNEGTAPNVMNRATIIPKTMALRDLYCGVQVAKTLVLWMDGGTEDGGGIVAGTTTPADITAAIGAMRQWFGADLLAYVRTGIIGADDATVDYKEGILALPQVRAAQDAAQSANIVAVYPHAMSRGTPFGALVVDADGYWIDGSSRHDGSHWTEAMANCVGRTSARNLAALLEA